MKSKNMIVKALLNGVISWLLVALVMNLMKDISFVKALTAPYTVFLAVTAISASFVGFKLKAMMH